MRVLMTGSNGQLGKKLIQSKPNGIDLITPSRDDLNFEETESCFEFVLSFKPDWIINCAAYTNVDKAEKERDKAYKINAIAPQEFSKALIKTGGKILQISTDYVFDGKNITPYLTNDIKSPINYYGITKSKGEEKIEEILGFKNQAIILRTSWLMSEYGKNFLTTIIKLLNEKEEIEIVSDQLGCPTSTKTLADVCWKIILNNKKIFQLNREKVPIFHYSDCGCASWYDVAASIKEFCIELNMFNKYANIKPILSKNYKTLTLRPNFSLLDNSKIRKYIDIPYIHWRESIKNCFNKRDK